MKNKNGITLIALVITIIVMLILVSVTISIAVNGGLFDYASNAVKDTKSAMENEQDISEFEDLVAQYTGEKKVIRISNEIARVKSASSFTPDENDPQHKANGTYVLTITDGNKEYDFNDTITVHKDEYNNELTWFITNDFGIFSRARKCF